MSAALAFACGIAAGWFGRRAFVRWRSAKALYAAMRGAHIVSRAP